MLLRFIVLMTCLAIVQDVLAQTEGLSFVILNKKQDAAQLPKEETDKLMEGHMANINRLAQEKKLVAAGPFDGGGGIFILNTASVEVSTEWLSTDPAVKAKRWDVEVYPYSPRVGGACLVQEPYEMVTYYFVRYKVDITKSTVNSASIFFSHDEHLKTLKSKLPVVAEGTFGDRDGGVLILKDDPPLQWLESDPAVQQGMLVLDLRKLWIAKGAFCEQ